ncbi:hypothetical protein V6N13_106378 [Hibiscus sabdariffa]|uniref:Uncharacterized protein n=1 Tax=Hibiscus sabdariffa TaxID=183260 RepID=A0ABR2F0K5_9ROSI
MGSSDVMGSGEAQGNLNVKVNVVSTSFKETLIGISDKSRGVNPIAELDVEVMNEDVRIGGVRGNGGTTTAREVRGSRFVTLSSAISDEVEGDVEPLLDGEEHGNHATHVTEKSVFADRDLGASTSVGITTGTHYQNQADRGKSVWGVCSTDKGTELVGQISLGVSIGSKRVRSGEATSVASNETVTQMPSSLNSAKHAVVRVGGTEEGRPQRIVKVRILSASLRGPISKPGSKVQLGGRWGPKNTRNSHKLDDRDTTKEGLAGRLSNLVSDLNVAAELEKARLVLPREPGDTDESRVDWQMNSVFDQPGGFEMQV